MHWLLSSLRVVAAGLALITAGGCGTVKEARPVGENSPAPSRLGHAAEAPNPPPDPRPNLQADAQVAPPKLEFAISYWGRIKWKPGEQPLKFAIFSDGLVVSTTTDHAFRVRLLGEEELQAFRDALAKSMFTTVKRIQRTAPDMRSLRMHVPLSDGGYVTHLVGKLILDREDSELTRAWFEIEDHARSLSEGSGSTQTDLLEEKYAEPLREYGGLRSAPLRKE